MITPTRMKNITFLFERRIFPGFNCNCYHSRKVLTLQNPEDAQAFKVLASKILERWFAGVKIHSDLRDQGLVVPHRKMAAEAVDHA
jgi:hypothetical protein